MFLTEVYAMPMHLVSKKTASLMVESIGILIVILDFVVGLVLQNP